MRRAFVRIVTGLVGVALLVVWRPASHAVHRVLISERSSATAESTEWPMEHLHRDGPGTVAREVPLRAVKPPHAGGEAQSLYVLRWYVLLHALLV